MFYSMEMLVLRCEKSVRWVRIGAASVLAGLALRSLPLVA
jgi:hypothetical protein